MRRGFTQRIVMSGTPERWHCTWISPAITLLTSIPLLDTLNAWL